MRIRHQLFLSLLGANALVILLMFALSSWSFNRGFLEYINQAESRRLSIIVARLERRYAEHQGWGWIENDKRQWRRMLSDIRPMRRPPREGQGAKATPPMLVDPRLLLADKDKNILIGRANGEADIQWTAIRANDEAVGYLGFRPLKRIADGFDRIFARQQQNAFIFAAILMTLVSAVVSIILTSRIVKPILSIDKALNTIAGGDYQQKLALERRDELGDLANNVNLLARTLEQNTQSRQRWIAEISHELRTPIAVLRGEIEALQDGVRKLTDDSLTSLHSETMRLSRLVDDLHDLNLSDLGALSYSMQRVDLAQIIEDCIAAHATEHQQKKLSVTLHNTDNNCQMRGDHQRLTQLFGNLMQNSIRYTDEGGSIAISLSGQGQDLCVRWCDSTPGVSDSHFPRLFDPLYRTEESRNREFGGSGLGLAIAEKIVQAHQGRITAEHSELGGLCILSELPRSPV